ncbi:hypothetical protein KNE206_30850 [Kitasatospora sp. NE20-6]
MVVVAAAAEVAEVATAAPPPSITQVAATASDRLVLIACIALFPFRGPGPPGTRCAGRDRSHAPDSPPLLARTGNNPKKSDQNLNNRTPCCLLPVIVNGHGSTDGALRRARAHSRRWPLSRRRRVCGTRATGADAADREACPVRRRACR